MIYMEKTRERHNPSRDLIKSKQRVADYGEVFTPSWLVDTMLDLVGSEASRVESRILEPACGNGNFLICVLQRKLATVEFQFGRAASDRPHYALLALMSIYGIELLRDNLTECRERMLGVFVDFLSIKASDDLLRAATYVLSLNLVHGDALGMRKYNDDPISFAEWEYLGEGKFQRRDFRLDALAQSSSFAADDSLFSSLSTDKALKPIRSYPPMAVWELARAGLGRGLKGIA